MTRNTSVIDHRISHHNGIGYLSHIKATLAALTGRIAAYFERHLFLTWLVFFIGAPVAILSAISLIVLSAMLFI